MPCAVQSVDYLKTIRCARYGFLHKSYFDDHAKGVKR